MWVVIPIVVGSVLLVVSGFAWAARREVLDRARAIDAVEPTTFGAVRPNHVSAVRGKIAGTPLTDPVTTDAVAFYEARVARVDGGDRTLGEVRGGETLVLEDESGTRAEVPLANAELAVPWVELEQSEREPSQRMNEVISARERRQIEPHAGAQYVLQHRSLRRGDALTVIGTPKREGNELRFAGEGTLIVTPDELGQVQARERADMRSMSRMLRASVVIGVLLVLLGAVLLFRA